MQLNLCTTLHVCAQADLAPLLRYAARRFPSTRATFESFGSDVDRVTEKACAKQWKAVEEDAVVVVARPKSSTSTTEQGNYLPYRRRNEENRVPPEGNRSAVVESTSQAAAAPGVSTCQPAVAAVNDSRD